MENCKHSPSLWGYLQLDFKYSNFDIMSFIWRKYDDTKEKMSTSKSVEINYLKGSWTIEVSLMEMYIRVRIRLNYLSLKSHRKCLWWWHNFFRVHNIYRWKVQIILYKNTVNTLRNIRNILTQYNKAKICIFLLWLQL